MCIILKHVCSLIRPDILMPVHLSRFFIWSIVCVERSRKASAVTQNLLKFMLISHAKLSQFLVYFVEINGTVKTIRFMSKASTSTKVESKTNSAFNVYAINRNSMPRYTTQLTTINIRSYVGFYLTMILTLKVTFGVFSHTFCSLISFSFMVFASMIWRCK